MAWGLKVRLKRNPGLVAQKVGNWNSLADCPVAKGPEIRKSWVDIPAAKTESEDLERITHKPDWFGCFKDYNQAKLNL